MILLIGILCAAGSAAAFWYCMPKGERVSPIVGSAMEPYLVIAMLLGFGLGIAAIGYGVADLLS